MARQGDFTDSTASQGRAAFAPSYTLLQARRRAVQRATARRWPAKAAPGNPAPSDRSTMLAEQHDQPQGQQGGPAAAAEAAANAGGGVPLAAEAQCSSAAGLGSLPLAQACGGLCADTCPALITAPGTPEQGERRSCSAQEAAVLRR